ncbi:GLPGLI family protein [Porphyromonas macacae]|uniref:GLPGLI family protein n=1 Tax=Porphyromonas macacae TaxID=28115 RepID=A0A379E920_9PORP|nr:GLPGLI family protein [Porphyromonas macacae]SUB88950.1 GLPGLI family protein [Porphyromonas macacae]
MKPNPFTIICALLILSRSISGYAQKTAENTQPEINDSARYRIVYRALQTAQKEHEPLIIGDSMALEIGDRWAVYYDFNKKIQDSIKHMESASFMISVKSISVNKKEEDLEARLQRQQQPYQISGGGNDRQETYRIYKNRNTGEVITIDNGPAVNPGEKGVMIVTENIPPQTWEITADTLSILGYNCQKATTRFRGRTYTVWFTLDLPISEGPWKLYGLPGLILKAEDGERLFTFEAIGLENISTEIPIEVVYPKTKKIVTTQAGLKQWYDFRNKKDLNITYTFHNGNGDYTIYPAKNPVSYKNMETEF